MPVESAADRAVFTNADEFGVAATYTKAGGSPVAISGIYDNGAVDALDDPRIASSSPRFICRTSDLPVGAAADDALFVEGFAYAVRVIRDDGTGMSELQLEETT